MPQLVDMPHGVVQAPPLSATAAGVSTCDVSVCIVNWNCRELLRACLSSLHHQEIPLEIIVVDNASTDGAADMVERDFPRVRLIRNQWNAGFAHANNQAANVARGDCLFFLNNDTVVPPGAVAKLHEFLQNQSDVVVVGPRLRDGKGMVQTSYRRRPTIATFLHRTWLLGWTGLFRRRYQNYRRMELDQTGAPTVEVLMGAALFMRRDDFFRIGGWDDRFRFGGEDLDLCFRANRHGRVVYWPAVEIVHYGRASTKANSGFASTQIAIGFVRYFRKTGATRPALFGYKLAVTLDAPLRIVGRSLQYLVHRFLVSQSNAERCRTELAGLIPFLWKDLPAFWAA